MGYMRINGSVVDISDSPNPRFDKDFDWGWYAYPQYKGEWNRISPGIKLNNKWYFSGDKVETPFYEDGVLVYDEAIKGWFIKSPVRHSRMVLSNFIQNGATNCDIPIGEWMIKHAEVKDDS